jgi:hypothetical protein
VAAITFATTAQNGTTLGKWNPALRSASAQATTGQTDWFWVPSWAKTLTVYFNLATITGTSSVPSLVLAYPSTLDDGDTATILTGATITAASFHTYEVGPTLTTAGTDSATADSLVVKNSVIPMVLGITITNVVGGGAFTYTIAASVGR